jgi:hypothetical protein
MKQQDYQFTLNQLFCHILPYLKLFGSKASHLFVKKRAIFLAFSVLILLIEIQTLEWVLGQIYIS